MRNCADTYKGNAPRQQLVREPPEATFAQTDPTLVVACHRETIDQPGPGGCPNAAEHTGEAEQSVPDYPRFPVAHAKKARTDNARERANRETRRRTDVVQCFPSKDSPVRLVGAVLVEENTDWQNGTRMFSPDPVATAHAYKAPTPTEWEVLQAKEKAKAIVKDAIDRAKEAIANSDPKKANSRKGVANNKAKEA